MNILHISDIHFRHLYPFASEGYDSVLYRMQSPLCALDTCAKKLANQVIDLILVSGDLCDEGMVGDYVILKEYFQGQFPNIPVIACPGNHDILANFKAGWLQLAADVKDGSSVLVLPEFVVLALDNTSGDANGMIGKRQVAWLSTKLKKYQSLPIILMMHHHLFKEQATIPSVPYDASFLNVLKQHPSITIMCGHTHHSYHDHFYGIPYYTAPSMSFCGEDLKDGSVKFEEKFGYHLYQYENGFVQSCCKEVFYDGKILNTITF